MQLDMRQKEIERSNNRAVGGAQARLADQESKTELGTSTCTCGKLWSLNRNRNNNKLVYYGVRSHDMISVRAEILGP